MLGTWLPAHLGLAGCCFRSSSPPSLSERSRAWRWPAQEAMRSPSAETRDRRQSAPKLLGLASRPVERPRGGAAQTRQEIRSRDSHRGPEPRRPRPTSARRRRRSPRRPGPPPRGMPQLRPVAATARRRPNRRPTAAITMSGSRRSGSTARSSRSRARAAAHRTPACTAGAAPVATTSICCRMPGARSSRSTMPTSVAGCGKAWPSGTPMAAARSTGTA
jgi:hypothetical protein